MVKVSDDPKKVIEATAKELLEKLKVETTVLVSEDGQDSFRVQIETDNSGLLIGYHGEVINSLQLLLGIIIYRKLGKWVRLIVDVGDYREKREIAIKKMAQDKAAEVESSGSPVSLPYLSPLERRIVHLILADHPKVTSVSEGEGKDRHVVLKPRESGDKADS